MSRLSLLLFCLLLPYRQCTKAPLIVALFEWSYEDIATECEQYLGPKGFESIQISPPFDHITGDSWNVRYQPVTYNLTSRSGNFSSLQLAVARCASAGVRIYADVVFNHMTAPPARTGRSIGGNAFTYRSYPIYGPEKFHHLPTNVTQNCEVDFSNRGNLQFCDLFQLADLSTEQEEVQAVVVNSIVELIGYGLHGLRVDSAACIPAADMKAILDAAATRLGVKQVPTYMEVNGVGGVSPYEYSQLGKVTEFQFASDVARHFRSSGSLQYLLTLGPTWSLLPSESAVVFITNHDLQRNPSGTSLTEKNGILYELAIIYMLAYPYGQLPVLLSSYYFDDPLQGPPKSAVHNGSKLGCGPGQPWICEHRWPSIAAMVKFRNAVDQEALLHPGIYLQGDMISFSRGVRGFVVINASTQEFKDRLQTGLPPGNYTNLLDKPGSANIEVSDGGFTYLEIGGRSAVAFMQS